MKPLGRTFTTIVVAALLAVFLALEPEWQVYRAHQLANGYCTNAKREGAYLDDEARKRCRANLIRSILVGADMR